MLFFAEAEEVGRVADLGLDFLLAIAVVVIGHNGDYHAAHVTAGELEGFAAVIEFVFITPAHAVATLQFRGVFEGRQAKIFLAQADQVWRQNHAASVAAPVLNIEGGVVFRQVRVARVAEDTFHEIEIAHQAGGREETRLHALAGFISRGGANGGAQQQADEQAHLSRLMRCEGECQGVLRWLQRGRQKCREGLFWNGDFVRRDGQPACHDVKNSFGGAAVTLRVVQDTLCHPVGLQPRRRIVVLTGGQRHGAAQPRAVQHESTARKAGGVLSAQIAVQKFLNARVCRAQATAQQKVFLVIVGQQGGGQFQKVRVGGFLADGLTQGG